VTDVEDLLTRDGAAWRAAQPAPLTELDPARLGRRPGPRWQPLAAAAAVVLVAVAGGLAASRPARPTGASPGAVVRDGDRVTGQGVVIAAPGRPVRLCLTPRLVRIGDGVACQVGIPLLGVDPARIPRRQEQGGTTWGEAVVTGVYRGGGVAVSALAAPPPQPPLPDDVPADRIDCPAPAGGWPRDSVPASAVDRLGRLVRAHPDRYALPFAHFPYAGRDGDTTTKAAVVMEVGTTGDVAAARRELGRVFPAAHLCVAPVRWNEATKAAATAALSTPAAAAVGIQAPLGERLDDVVEVELLVLDEAASRFLAGVAGGRVVPRPVLTKTG
jgi:hypothetical protein